MDRTLSGATTMGQSGPESNGNEGVLHIISYLKLYYCVDTNYYH